MPALVGVTCNSVEGSDAEQSYYSHVDVPA